MGFFVGSYLGDGGFVKRSKTHNTYVVFAHAEDQYPYLEWKYNFLKKYWIINSDKKITEKKVITQFENAQRQFTFSTKSIDYLNYFKLNERIDIIDNINEMSIAIWIMDDGSFNKGSIKVCCGTMSEYEKNKIHHILLDRFGIENYIYKHPTNSIKDYIRITNKCSEKCFKIIEDNIDIDTLLKLKKYVRRML